MGSPFRTEAALPEVDLSMSSMLEEMKGGVKRAGSSWSAESDRMTRQEAWGWARAEGVTPEEAVRVCYSVFQTMVSEGWELARGW